MRRTDSLFQLVKSLNRTDKRNFKLLTQLTSGSKKYLRLFESIDRQNTYDEARLIRQFKGDPMVKQFSVTKNYLYNSILRSLVHFHQGMGAGLSKMVLQIRILADKNLLPQAYKLLRKAKKRAAEIEDFYELLQLLELEREILHEHEDQKDYDSELRAIAIAESDAGRMLENLRSYRHLLDQAILIANSSRQARQSSDLQAFRELLETELMRDPETALSLRSRILYHRVWQLYHVYNSDLPAAELSGTACRKEMEASRLLRDEWMSLYLDLLYEQGRVLLGLGRSQEVNGVLQDMAVCKVRAEKTDLLRQERRLHLRLLAALEAGKVKEGIVVLEELGSALEEWDGKVRRSNLLEIYYYAAWMSLVAGNAKEALRWINAFLYEPRTEVRQDLQCHARLANLIIHHELGNDDLVEHSLKSTIRFVFKRNRMCQVERLVVRTVRTLIQLEEADDAGNVFLAMYKELNLLAEDPLERAAMRTLFLPAWLESKVKSGGMARALQENAAILSAPSTPVDPTE